MGGLLGSEGHLNVTRIGFPVRYACCHEDFAGASVKLQAGSVQTLDSLICWGKKCKLFKLPLVLTFVLFLGIFGTPGGVR